MYLEFIVGPLLALAIGVKFTVLEKEKTIKELEAKISVMEKGLDSKISQMESELDSNLAKKMLTVLKPVAVEVQKVKDTVGV